MQNYNLSKLISVDEIFLFFKNSGYEIEDITTPFIVSELVEKGIEGTVWTVIDQQELTVLIIQSQNYNQKTYRSKVNNYLKELVGIKIIFFTQDFSHYNLTLIYNGVYNVKFKPEEPEMSAIRLLESLQNKEDLFDYTKEDVNIILLERELTAKGLIYAIKEKDDSSVKIAFKEGGLNLIGQGKDKIIISLDDAPISDMAVDVKLNYLHKNIQEIDIDIIASLYKKEVGRDVKIICLITKKGLLYYWYNYSISGYISYINQLNENVMEDVLESLIAQVSYRTAFNSETFHQQFGTYSPFFILGINLFKKYIEKEYEKINIMYKEWKSRFSKVYQAGDLDEELFLKHSYLSLLVKTVLISKFLSDKEELSGEESLKKLFEIFEQRGIPIFINDFFHWSIEEKKVQSEILVAVQDGSFIVDDLFRTIYQEMVSPATRHALGEFYTPAPLARMMVEEVYEFGQYVLDPACGSGTFLVEILNIIGNANKKIEEKIEAFSKVYGFDVNPIAILVSRSNLLLITDKLFKDEKTVPINVYLTDSLNPIDEFKPILKDKKRDKKVEFHSIEKWSDYGEVERFNMPAINDSLIINKKFFKYPEQFSEILKELDKNLSKDIKFDDLMKKIYSNINDIWLEEKCEGNSNKTLKDNFEFISQKFFKFIKEDQNHIWAYLLYNAIGVRKMKETIDGVDLIIGNPPWLTIADIMSYDYKENVKKISKDLGIYMGGKYTPHTEICSIFFYKVRDLYLRKKGKIFFVTTATIETGGQHSKFRMFKRFKNIFIWKFRGEDIFRVHNICIGAVYANQPLMERLKVDVKLFKSTQKYKNWKFELEGQDMYVPYNYDNISHDNEAKRLIPLTKKETMLPIGESHYKDKFYQGASLVPRCFFFIKILPDKTIVPNKTLIQHEPWDFYPLNIYDIESEYIYTIAKSTELVPFALLRENKCFLPIERDDYTYHQEKIKPKAKETYKLFANKYNEIQENDARELTNLWKNINYLNKLTNLKQRSHIKVIYNGSGSILKSAIIKGEIIIDSTLFYIGLEKLEEAIYLCAILNAPCLTKHIEKTGTTGASGSIRHIQKRALDFPIPKYNENNELHNKIVEIGRNCENITKNIIQDLKIKKLNYLKTRMKCKYCGKTYAKSSFLRNRDIHEAECDKIFNDHNWSDGDWIDLKEITIEEIELTRMKTQNMIFSDETMIKKLEELDEFIIELLSSESG